MNKIKVKSTKARVSLLFVEDMKFFKDNIFKNYNINLSLPATYNLIRPELLQMAKQRLKIKIQILDVLKTKKNIKKEDLFKLLK